MHFYESTWNPGVQHFCFRLAIIYNYLDQESEPVGFYDQNSANMLQIGHSDSGNGLYRISFFCCLNLKSFTSCEIYQEK